MRAIRNNLIIKKIEEQNQSTKGGLLLTEKQREDVRFQKAEVIKIGDEVVLYGTQQGNEITVGEVAAWGSSSVYKVVIGMNPLLPRIYL